jgi:hypothetical protein
VADSIQQATMVRRTLVVAALLISALTGLLPAPATTAMTADPAQMSRTLYLTSTRP